MDPNTNISRTIDREWIRLRSFIRRRVADESDVEDILQDVFADLIEASRMPEPIEQVGAWLFRVAKNRIIDVFRKKKPSNFSDEVTVTEDGEAFRFEDLLPSSDDGPEAAYVRMVLLEEIAAAIEELPSEQREAFVAHELEGQSFKELAAATGVSVNTLISRKHYAVLHLRRRLQWIHDEFTQK